MENRQTRARRCLLPHSDPRVLRPHKEDGVPSEPHCVWNQCILDWSCSKVLMGFVFTPIIRGLF